MDLFVCVPLCVRVPPSVTDICLSVSVYFCVLMSRGNDGSLVALWVVPLRNTTHALICFKKSRTEGQRMAESTNAAESGGTDSGDR